jgi:telomerase reverse transcriptase
MDEIDALAIPGIVSQYPNNHVSILRGQVWNDLLVLMGSGKNCIMLELILDCGIFTTIESGRGNLYQLSGQLHLRISR